MFQFRPFPPYTYLIQCTVTEYCSVGFPHSEIHGYNGYLLLPVAYRSLSRPSSAPDAKAFPLRSFQLDLFEIWFSIVELCRQFNGSFCLRNCYPHLYDVPQLKQITFCCLAYHFLLIVQFSRYGVDRSSVSFAAAQAPRLIHFALSPFPRTNTSLVCARRRGSWL